MDDFQRNIDPSTTYNALVDWMVQSIVYTRKAPGFILGLSGTDSIVTFLAAYDAMALAGKSERMLGVHFAPSDDFLDDHPEAETHLWFKNEVVPWLMSRCPKARIRVDTSVDWRADGLRWGALAEMSIIERRGGGRRFMLPPEEQFWLVGTRNRTEAALFNYSMASVIASVQPIVGLWKSDILDLSAYLDVPRVAIDRSCEVDCICGRQALPARHVRELDLILKARAGDVTKECVERSINAGLRGQLDKFIEEQLRSKLFKSYIPYMPVQPISRSHCDHPMVRAFQDGTLELRGFGHRKHLFIAWRYLLDMPFANALELYSKDLHKLLSAKSHGVNFSQELTNTYFSLLEKAMRENPTATFDELADKVGRVHG